MARGAKAAYGVDLSKLLATRQASAVVLQLLASVFRDALRAELGMAKADVPRPPAYREHERAGVQRLGSDPRGDHHLPARREGEWWNLSPCQPLGYHGRGHTWEWGARFCVL